MKRLNDVKVNIEDDKDHCPAMTQLTKCKMQPLKNGIFLVRKNVILIDDHSHQAE